MKMNIFWKSRFWAVDRHGPSPPPISAERARRPVLRRDVGRITTADLAEARGSAANFARRSSGPLTPIADLADYSCIPG